METKISFCTVCMNRLHHLRQTLPENIADNSSEGVEFLVLDYGSSDGLSQWVKQEMSHHIDAGRLSYYRYDAARYFDRSHSRNKLFTLASGEIICNVDADNYLGKNFYKYVQSVFENNADIFLIPDTKKRYYYIRDALGRIALKKQDFLAIRGYDERMKGYGFEDDDLYARLLRAGKSEYVIRDLQFLKTIQHTNETRVENEFLANALNSLLICYESSRRSHVILLYTDGSFNAGAIVRNPDTNPSPAVIENLEWTQGTWEPSQHDLLLHYENKGPQHLVAHRNGFLLEEKLFYKIDDPAFRGRLPYEISLMTNYSYALLNRDTEFVNIDGFGKGAVQKNFLREQINHVV